MAKILIFEAWVNRNSRMDPGHMVVKDCDAGRYLEFGQVPVGTSPPTGGIVNDCITSEGPSQHDSSRTTVFPRYEDSAGPGRISVIDSRTGEKRHKDNDHLMLRAYDSDNQFSIYFNDQYSRVWGKEQRPRFTHILLKAVAVSDDEYSQLRENILCRFAGGIYNLYKEMSVLNPLATRCLSMLEDLARMRGIKLESGSAETVLRQFCDEYGMGDPSEVEFTR